MLVIPTWHAVISSEIWNFKDFKHMGYLSHLMDNMLEYELFDLVTAIL